MNYHNISSNMATMKLLECSWLLSVVVMILAAAVTSVEGSCVSTGRNCKRSCDNLDTGNYQTCSDCNGYMTCSSVGTVQTRCAPGLVWDDDMKGCTWKTNPSSESSKTCKCLQTMPDEDDYDYDGKSYDGESGALKHSSKSRRPIRRRKRPTTTEAPKPYVTRLGFSRNCLACICEVEGCLEQYMKCRLQGSTISCGPFQIKEPYWIDAYRPGNAWMSCTKSMKCSTWTVKAYMKRYGRACAYKAGAKATCEVFARVHNGGPSGCIAPYTVAYWKQVHACCVKKGGC